MTKRLIETDEFYTADEAAEELGKGIATVWRMIRDKRLITIRILGRTLVPKGEIERLKKLQLEESNVPEG